MGLPGNRRILFLDDSGARHEAFLRALDRLPGEAEVHRVYTAEQAIALLDRLSFGWVLLDHDLDEADVMCQVAAPTVVPTGMAVVDHILTMESPPPEVTIHSCNAPAAMEMHLRLEGHPAGIRVNRCPFPFLLQVLR